MTALVVLLSTPALAADLPSRSLFFPSGQAPVATYTGAVPSASVTSSGDAMHNFIYTAPTQWSFWWRGQRITPQARPATIVVESVTADTVVFTDNGQRWQFEVGKFNKPAP